MEKQFRFEQSILGIKNQRLAVLLFFTLTIIFSLTTSLIAGSGFEILLIQLILVSAGCTFWALFMMQQTIINIDEVEFEIIRKYAFFRKHKSIAINKLKSAVVLINKEQSVTLKYTNLEEKSRMLHLTKYNDHYRIQVDSLVQALHENPFLQKRQETLNN